MSNKQFVAFLGSVYIMGFFQVHFPLLLLYSPEVFTHFLQNFFSSYTPEPFFSLCFFLLLSFIAGFPCFFYTVLPISMFSITPHTRGYKVLTARNQETFYLLLLCNGVLFLTILCRLDVLPFPLFSLILFLFCLWQGTGL